MASVIKITRERSIGTMSVRVLDKKPHRYMFFSCSVVVDRLESFISFLERLCKEYRVEAWIYPQRTGRKVRLDIAFIGWAGEKIAVQERVLKCKYVKMVKHT